MSVYRLFDNKLYVDFSKLYIYDGIVSAGDFFLSQQITLLNR